MKLKTKQERTSKGGATASPKPSPTPGSVRSYAKDLATKFVTGYLDYGSGRGGLHPDQIAELIERNVFTFGTRRLVLDIELASDDYHLNLKVLAADKDAADQLEQMAEAIHKRRHEGEPS